MARRTTSLKRYFPIFDWLTSYNKETLTSDLVAAVIVTIMLIPQSLAYALLAGLPAEVGLYASIAPLVIYAVFGTSRALAVGPVAVASLMTAAAAGQLAANGTPEYYTAAILLAYNVEMTNWRWGEKKRTCEIRTDEREGNVCI